LAVSVCLTASSSIWDHSSPAAYSRPTTTSWARTSPMHPWLTPEAMGKLSVQTRKCCEASRQRPLTGSKAVARIGSENFQLCCGRCVPHQAEPLASCKGLASWRVVSFVRWSVG
jgi:hypothetical protein